MINRKIDRELEKFYSENQQALLLTGARQIGKTYSIRRFGEKNFRHFIEINFVNSPEAAELFRQNTTASEILLRLSAWSTEPLVPGETLIFFDEVQECPEIVTAIKFLVEDGRFRYVLSGSLLGVTLKDLRSAPVGYMAVKEMFPLDIEEFVRALSLRDDVIEHIMEAWRTRSSVDEFVHKKMMELFRLYLIVGGMPAVVARYLETNDLRQVMEVQRDILGMYKQDISKYDFQHKLYIEEIFDLIPAELNAKNKRFVLKNLNENIKFSRHEHSFIWLKDAGVALPTYNVEEPVTPLLLARSRNLFKLFQNDVGLLAAQYVDGLQLRILKGDKDINYGAVYENVAAQELRAHGFSLYYFNSKRQGEVDFLIEQNGKVWPIEIKSGKDYQRHRALNNLLQETNYKIDEAFVFTNDNLRVEGSIVYAPMYMLMCLHKDVADLPIYKVDVRDLI